MRKIILSILVTISIFLGINIFYKYDLSDLESTKIYDQHGILLVDLRGVNGRKENYTSRDQIPDFIKQIIIYREDKRFYSHPGIDILAWIRATYYNIKQGQIIQGASTIDQQVIKLSQNAFTRSWGQKFKEIFLAININFHYSKKEILTYYTNNLPFSNGVIGFKSACNIYFGVNCEILNQGNIIYLFTISKFGKIKNIENYATNFALKLGFKDYSREYYNKINNNLIFQIENKTPFYINYLINKYSNISGNFITSFNYDLYQKIEGILSDLLPYLRSKRAEDGCVLVLNKNKQILSMNILKSYGDEKGGYINACLRKRQLGSVMKPFLYILALKNLNINGDSTIIDEPVSYFLDNGGKYEPKNFDLKYHGQIKIAQALGSSLNIPAVKLLHSVGLDNYRNFLKEIGNIVGTNEKRDDNFSEYGLSLALGTKELSVLDFALMWTIFLPDNNNLFQSDQGKKFFLTYQKEINEIRNILSDNRNRLISFNINNWLNIPDFYAKTGTSRHFVDGWTCGGNGEVIICVWMGNYDGSAMQDSCINTAGVVWHQVANLFSKY